MQVPDMKTILIVAAFLSVFATLVAQALKRALPEDDNGGGPRRFLPLIMILGTAVLSGVLGWLFGGDIITWVLAGMIAGAASSGVYKVSGLAVPGLFNTNGWLGGGRG